jgi:hypothetical protein
MSDEGWVNDSHVEGVFHGRGHIFWRIVIVEDITRVLEPLLVKLTSEARVR